MQVGPGKLHLQAESALAACYTQNVTTFIIEYCSIFSAAEVFDCLDTVHKLADVCGSQTYYSIMIQASLTW